MNQIHPTREAWLACAVDELRPMFGFAGRPLMAQRIRVSCAFPTTHSRTGATGQCFAATSSADASVEIMVSPELANPLDVFAVLVAQLAHATDGAMSYTSSTYGPTCAAMGLDKAGPTWRTTLITPEFISRYQAIVDSLGDYPHATLSTEKKATQGTRQMKAVCPTCGFIIRLSKRWADQGMPTCHDGDTFNLVEEVQA